MRHRSSITWLALATALAVSSSQSVLAQARPSALVEEARNAVVDSFALGPVDEAAWASGRDALDARPDATEDDARATIRALLAELGDPSTRLLTADEFTSFGQDVSGAPGPGVGLLELLSIDVDRRTGRVTVVTPVPGSPAERAGLEPGDTIASVDGRSTQSASLSEVVARLRGAEGTTVRVELRRGRRAYAVSLRRERATPLEPVTASMLEDGSRRLGYVAVRQFTAGAGDAVRAAVERLAREGAVGFVVDLRGDPGGLLTECAAVAGVFLGERVIARVRGKGGAVRDLTATGTAVARGSVVVLVDEGTASAAEVLAGALHDAGGATLVGRRTFGKGLVHEPRSLSDGSVLLVTTGRMLTPSGRDILEAGLIPDVEVARTGDRDAELRRAMSAFGRGTGARRVNR